MTKRKTATGKEEGKRKKLRLNKETVKDLTAKEGGKVKGGGRGAFPTTPGDCASHDWACPPDWPQ